MTSSGSPRHRRAGYAAIVGVAFGALAVGVVLPFTIDPADPDAAVSVGSLGMSAPDTRTGHDGDITTAYDGDRGGSTGGQTSGRATRTGITSPTGQPTAAQVGPSNETGVGPAEILTGVVLLDLGGLGGLGVGIEGLSPEEQQDGFQAAIDAVNAAGGVHGRTIKPAYETMDPIKADDLRRVCLEMAEDKEVFAVLNIAGFVGAGSLCLTEEHGVPYVFHDGEPDEWYQRSNGLMFSIPGSKSRVARNWVAELHQQGALKGKRIGVLSVDFDTDTLAVERALLPALADLGYEVTHRSHVARDLGTASSQMPVEVQQMRVKGVEIVLLTAGFTYSVPFVQEAEAQLWFPAWTVSDFAGMASDLSTSSMPRSFDQAIGYTGYRTGEGRTAAAEPDLDRACRERYEALVGSSLDRNSGTYRTALFACNLVTAYHAGLDRAGTTLTRRGFSEGMQSIGDISLTFSAGGSFRPGKFDALDHIRTIRWRFDCRCWLPVDSFHRSRF